MSGLLAYCATGGCGAKIAPDELSEYLRKLPLAGDPNLLVGFGDSDDAAVYKVSPDMALVATVDFFPPMVEDACLFGRIAAANALSDVYAMGAKALIALNLVCFPQKIDKVVLGEILAGGAEKVREAGAVLCGGHSIYDHEPKYGLAVTGMAHPDRILRNNTCKTDDALILTKPLGVGLVMSAVRAGLVSEEAYDATTASMVRLNKYAAEKMAAFPVNACTDITGFGLLIHASEMAGEAHTLTINFDSLPVLPGARRYAEDFLATAAGQRNRNHIRHAVDIALISAAGQELLFDPQTSGGLLISLPADQADALCAEIRKDDPAAAVIGVVSAREEYAVVVV
jgi:selenide,water dikinase